jgi:tRNA threonylcarbamoyl adenosine modification protein (Sua5/YciO/YrdC/YwlC family)
MVQNWFRINSSILHYAYSYSSCRSSTTTVSQVAEVLRKGGVIIYPTDTIYGLGCDISQPKAIERICRIKEVSPQKAQFSFICYDLSDLSHYARQIDTSVYRSLKQHLPGPYTFILEASRQVPKLLKTKKDTVGITGS